MSRRRNGEGTVFLRKDGRWAGVLDLGWEGGKRNRKNVYGSTQREAGQKLDALRRALADGLPVTNDRLTLAAFLHSWLNDTIDPSSLAPATKASYRDMTERHIIPILGRRPLSKVNPRDVQGLLTKLRNDGYSPRTAQLVHAILRRALHQAEGWGMVPRNVAKLVQAPRPRTNPDKVHALTLTDAKALLSAAVGHRLQALFVVLLMCGLRRGEVLGLRWSDLDVEAETLRVEQQVQRIQGLGLTVQSFPKTGSSRRVLQLPPECVEALQAHRARQAAERLAAGARWHDHGLIFPSTIGTPMEPRSVNRQLHSLCDVAGIQRERVHNLRHTTGPSPSPSASIRSSSPGYSATSPTLSRRRSTSTASRGSSGKPQRRSERRLGLRRDPCRPVPTTPLGCQEGCHTVLRTLEPTWPGGGKCL